MILSLACVMAVLALFWLGGFDFDTRGDKAVICSVLAIIFGGIGFALGILTEAD